MAGQRREQPGPSICTAPQAVDCLLFGIPGRATSSARWRIAFYLSLGRAQGKCLKYFSSHRALCSSTISARKKRKLCRFIWFQLWWFLIHQLTLSERDVLMFMSLGLFLVLFGFQRLPHTWLGMWNLSMMKCVMFAKMYAHLSSSAARKPTDFSSRHHSSCIMQLHEGCSCRTSYKAFTFVSSSSV